MLIYLYAGWLLALSDNHSIMNKQGRRRSQNRGNPSEGRQMTGIIVGLDCGTFVTSSSSSIIYPGRACFFYSFDRVSCPINIQVVETGIMD